MPSFETHLRHTSGPHITDRDHGRHLLFGPVTRENLFEVGMLVADAIGGVPGVFVVVNELFGNRPEIKFDTPTVETKEHGITIAGFDAYTTISPGYATVEEAIAGRYDGDRFNQRWITVNEHAVMHELFAPGGNHIWWTWAATPTGRVI